MAAKMKKRRAEAIRTAWNELTWDDLEAWADPGSLERGDAYFHGGNVESIALTTRGELLAWVQGSERYAVQVALGPADESPRLTSLCTCPVGFACKHAVSAVLTYLDAAANGTQIPIAARNDLRLRLLDEDWDSGVDEEPKCDGDEVLSPQARRKLGNALKPNVGDLRSVIEAKSREELVELAMQLSKALLDLQSELNNAATLLVESAQSADSPSGGRKTRSKRVAGVLQMLR